MSLPEGIPCFVDTWRCRDAAEAWKTEAAEESMGEQIVRRSSLQRRETAVGNGRETAVGNGGS